MGAHRDFPSHCYSDRASDVFAPLFRYSGRDAHRGNSPWLRHDYLYRALGAIQQKLGHLRRLAASSTALNEHDLILGYRIDDIGSFLVRGQRLPLQLYRRARV